MNYKINICLIKFIQLYKYIYFYMLININQ